MRLSSFWILQGHQNFVRRRLFLRYRLFRERGQRLHFLLPPFYVIFHKHFGERKYPVVPLNWLEKQWRPPSLLRHFQRPFPLKWVSKSKQSSPFLLHQLQRDTQLQYLVYVPPVGPRPLVFRANRKLTLSRFEHSRGLRFFYGFRGRRGFRLPLFLQC